MALARCEECAPPIGTKHQYTHRHELFSISSHHNLCGGSGCARPVSIIWLNDEEEQKYLRGERVFTIGGARGEVRVT